MKKAGLRDDRPETGVPQALKSFLLAYGLLFLLYIKRLNTQSAGYIPKVG
jgi:hypothetical protein